MFVKRIMTLMNIGAVGVGFWQLLAGAAWQDVLICLLLFVFGKRFLFGLINPIRKPGILKTFLWIFGIFAAITWVETKLGIQGEDLTRYMVMVVIIAWAGMTLMGAALAAWVGEPYKPGAPVPGVFTPGSMGLSEAQKKQNAIRQRRIGRIQSLGFGKWCGFFVSNE